jgi:hypothetical protein
MTRPCTCDRCGQCRLCWLYYHDAAYRALWDGPAAPAATAPPCRHLGAATGRTVACPSCAGTVALKLFACGVHGRCTAGRQVAGVACCASCDDFSPPIAG